MQVDIYIKEREGSREIRVPWLPDSISIGGGDISVAEYKIIDKGDVAVPTGIGLASYSWQSAWPGENRTDQSLQRGTWQDPKTYHATMKDWAQKGTSLNLLVTGYPINVNVFIKKYEAQAAGAFGDLAYSVEFQEERTISIATETVTAAHGGNGGTTRPSNQGSQYTIKSGDTLWGIAKRFYGAGTKWPTIYNANKDIIESTAKKRGYRSSSNGHWIFPGVKITIPK